MFALLPRPRAAQPPPQPGADRADGAGDRARHRREHDHADRAPRAVGRPDPAARATSCSSCSSIRDERNDGYTPGEEPRRSADALRRRDAAARSSAAMRQAMMTGGSAAIEPQRAGHGSVLSPTRASRRPTSSRCSTRRSSYGSGWTRDRGRQARRAWWSSRKDLSREAVRRRRQRRQVDPRRPARLPHRRRARRLAADAALLRPEQRALRRARAGVRAVPDVARPGAWTAAAAWTAGTTRRTATIPKATPASMHRAPGSSTGCELDTPAQAARVPRSTSSTTPTSSAPAAASSARPTCGCAT